jgi:hypothetical protein
MKKNGLIRIRVEGQDLKRMKRLQKIMGFKTLSSFIRFTISSEISRMTNDNNYLKEYWIEAHTGWLDSRL